MKVKAFEGRWRKKAKQLGAEETVDRKAEQISKWEEEEWVAEPDQGVLLTLVPQADGGNFIKKIRFRCKLLFILFLFCF